MEKIIRLGFIEINKDISYIEINGIDRYYFHKEKGEYLTRFEKEAVDILVKLVVKRYKTIRLNYLSSIKIVVDNLAYKYMMLCFDKEYGLIIS